MRICNWQQLFFFFLSEPPPYYLSYFCWTVKSKWATRPFARTLTCVPFPAPGGPSRMARMPFRIPETVSSACVLGAMVTSCKRTKDTSLHHYTLCVRTLTPRKEVVTPPIADYGIQGPPSRTRPPIWLVNDTSLIDSASSLEKKRIPQHHLISGIWPEVTSHIKKIVKYR